MKILENTQLAEYTTFKIGGPARFFCKVTSEDELVEAVTFAKEKGIPFFILGGGSNILISDGGFKGLVVKMEMRGVTIDGVAAAGSEVIVSAAAGEQWDDLVALSVERGLYGLENLSAIPGTVGAVPIQNIGAYGADVSQVIFKVRALDTKTMKLVDLSSGECAFEYRDSLFKREKGRYVVTRVDFKLKKDGQVNTSYKDVDEYFKAKNNANPTIKEVRDAVIDIRWKKLPDWKLWGTAGSFFKNPVISKERFDELKERYPDLPSFPKPDGRVKVSLAWILDNVCLAKDISMGNARVHGRQPLVLVSTPGGSAGEIVELSRKLMKLVKDKTGIEVEAEVEWVN